MKQRQNSEERIGQKLNQITAPQIGGLWEQMKTILDKRMAEPNSRVALYLAVVKPAGEAPKPVMPQEAEADCLSVGK